MPSVRLISVVNPLEQPTSSRVSMSLVFCMMQLVIEGQPFWITKKSLKAGEDFISAEEIARAIVILIQSHAPNQYGYNIAAGTYIMVPDIFNMFKKIEPAFTYTVVELYQADRHRDPANRYARWDAYTIEKKAKNSDGVPDH